MLFWDLVAFFLHLMWYFFYFILIINFGYFQILRLCHKTLVKQAYFLNFIPFCNRNFLIFGIINILTIFKSCNLFSPFDSISDRSFNEFGVSLIHFSVLTIVMVYLHFIACVINHSCWTISRSSFQRMYFISQFLVFQLIHISCNRL